MRRRHAPHENRCARNPLASLTFFSRPSRRRRFAFLPLRDLIYIVQAVTQVSVVSMDLCVPATAPVQEVWCVIERGFMQLAHPAGLDLQGWTRLYKYVFSSFSFFFHPPLSRFLDVCYARTWIERRQSIIIAPLPPLFF